MLQVTGLAIPGHVGPPAVAPVGQPVVQEGDGSVTVSPEIVKSVVPVF